MKNYSVHRGGFVIGNVLAASKTEAEVRASEQYGSDITVQELGVKPPDLLEEFASKEAPLMLIPDWEMEIIESSSIAELRDDINLFFRDNRGIRVKDIKYNSVATPSTSSGLQVSNSPSYNITHYAYILFYRIIEFPMQKTLDETFKAKEITTEQIQAEKAFFQRLMGDLQTNEALFEYARTLEDCRWVELRDEAETRKNCVQAIRKNFGWI